MRFFDGRTATPLSPARNVHTGQVTSLVWSKAAGHPLVSGSLDKQAIVYDRDAGEICRDGRKKRGVGCITCWRSRGMVNLFIVV